MMDGYTDHGRHGNNYMRRNAEVIDPPGHATDLFSDWAADYLRERAEKKDQPFFLYLAYNAPHFPIEPPADWLEKVKQRAPQLDHKRAKNVAFIEHLDAGIGRVLAALKETGLERDTLVVFTADNGGLRVPFMARWPGRIEAGSTCDYTGLVFDLFPTFAELLGTKLPTHAGEDSVSFLPVLLGTDDKTIRSSLISQSINGSFAIRHGQWKLALCPGSGGWSYPRPGRDKDNDLPEFQLYDLSTDPGGYLNQRHAHNHFPDFLWRNEERLTLPNVVTPVGGDGAGYATKAVQFADDLFADEAIKFVTNNKSKPFFLYWSMVIPHANNERTRVLKNGAHVPDFGPYVDKDWPEPDKGRAAMISRLDAYVGRMLATLREQGLAENTLVIFTSDNGPHDESNHNLERFNPSGLLTGIKRSLTDGGIRVPMIAWWPGKVPTGSTTDHVAYFGDWMATAAELAGAKVPAGCDSISFVPNLLGQPADQQPEHEFLYWEFHERGFKQAALYQGRWKGIRSGSPDAPVALYDQQTEIADDQ